ncbi:hypothetical protein EJ04DRAFT_87502 [Polyplosphaeria fusca]|uniref:Prolyl 4-hydroxylase alpha subunit domain-containing protein n=1 Tax=Polyplosphaeria fusca TaxID=682080 RepID=A0A9P4R6Y4_9PLEO|nr:hypothetical protein EJ04DRAFT_87502 [Polyplosphaeria fusca]
MALSISTLIQILFLGALAYILAGAPLLSLLSSSSTTTHPATQHLSHAKAQTLLAPPINLTCPDHAYKTHIFSRDPLVIYIQNFLSASEAAHVVSISEPLFSPSTVWTEDKETLNEDVRRSDKAKLPRDDVVLCIEERARAFQGWRKDVFIERLWSQRYGVGGHYRHHYDWGTGGSGSGRVSSFLVYLEAGCTGGGTEFPRLRGDGGDGWCEFLECGEGEGEREGVTFRPIAGNAVFWENLRADGSGYEESWHAGLPVTSGKKIGMNIWSWLQEGYRPAELV